MKSFAPTLISVFALLCTTSADFPGIARQDMMEEIEHILVDNVGTNSVGLVGAVTPCSNYASGASTAGESTSAEWVRFAFHDFVTANVAAGTGGLDMSLGFESDRLENEGLFVNDTMSVLVQSMNAYASMSDQLALGVLAAVAHCGGNAAAIAAALKIGRIDALEAGPYGVPTPFTPLAPTLAQFALAGMSASDTVTLTACGHSLGRVHAAFDDSIVSASNETPDNTLGGVPFDSTPNVLDPTGMNEYLTGTGQKGGPLVTSSNISARSDLRLFSSDGNATIKNLATNTGRLCSAAFVKMLNTVPSTVSLSPVTVMPWKMTDFTMHCSPGGSVRIEGQIRALWTTTPPPAKIPYYYTTKSGAVSTHTSDSASGSGYGMFGNTTYYHFVIATQSPGTVSMTFQNYTYPINDELFILASQSTVKPAAGTIEIKAAVLTSSLNNGTMNGTLYVPENQQGSLGKKITLVNVPMKAFSVNGNYTLFDGLVKVSNTSGVIAKVAVGGLGSKTVKTSLFAQD